MACKRCEATVGPMQDGDVAMCTACGQWWEARAVRMGTLVRPAREPITPSAAAERAREAVRS